MSKKLRKQEKGKKPAKKKNKIEQPIYESSVDNPKKSARGKR